MIMLMLLELGNAVPCSTRSDINLNRRHCYDRSLVIRDRNGSTVVETDMCQLAQAMKAEHAAKRPVTVHEYRGRRARTQAIPFSTLDSQMFVHTATCGCECRQPRPTHIVCTGERPFLGVHSLSKSEQQHEAQTHTHTHVCSRARACGVDHQRYTAHTLRDELLGSSCVEHDRHGGVER